VDLEHTDFNNKLRTDIDKDFVNDDDKAQDDHGHGTHVAGIAAAATNNDQGIVGLGWNAEILPLKVLSEKGGGSLSDLTSAIYYATDSGANIINLSLATNPAYNLHCSQFPALIEALEYAYNHGVLTIVAAGNDNDDASKVVPANCPYVLTVAATESNDTRASFSNYGDVIDIAAPGVSIYSTILGNRYGVRSGTSMSTPFVAGLASLVWAKYPTYTPSQVTEAILNNATDLGETGWDNKYGCGRINALNAVVHGANRAPSCRTTTLRPTSMQKAAAIAQVKAPEETYVAGHLIVRLKDDRTQDTLPSEYNTETLQTLADGTILVRVPEGTEWDTAQRLLLDGMIMYAQPDYLVFAQ
jgi:subtilisin family serine protease